jgi:hypothetical protein
MQLSVTNIRGESLAFTDPYIIGSIGGLGLPPVAHASGRFAQQDGATLRHVALEPRVLSVPFEILSASYAAMWGSKADLYGFLSAVRSKYVWTATLPDGTRRCLDTYFSGELSMPFDPAWGPLVHRDLGQWTAYDPTWYDPASTLWAFGAAGGAGSFGWEPDGLGMDAGWGASAADGTPKSFTYNGSWRAFPKITLQGPMATPVITHHTTGLVLAFDAGYSLGVGETVVIDLRQGFKTVIHSVDGNIPDALTDDSDLGTWHLVERPYAAGGVNSIGVAFTGGSADSRVYIRFNARYLAMVG